MPSPVEIHEHPEDAVLALLDETTLVAVRSLVAAHPELDDHQRPYWAGPPTPTARSARQVISRAYELLGALADYRRTRDADDVIDEDDIP
ncbi:MAG: hypothetical protein M3Q61_03300, partial [Chloroflexota bacterium]|nr:hypothetical protein [Chloroflexota bacterium]